MDVGPLPGETVKVAILVLVFICAFISSLAQNFYISVNENQVFKLMEQGNKRAKRLNKLFCNKRSTSLASLRMADMFFAMLFSAYGVLSYSAQIAMQIYEACQSNSKLQFISYNFLLFASALLLAFVLCNVHITFCRLLTRKIAMQNPQKHALVFSGIIAFIAAVFHPFTFLSTKIAAGIMRIFGLDPNADETKITEEEIRMLVDEGEEKGVLENIQRDMINNIFDFDDIHAGDIMTHRTDIEAINVDADISEVVDLAIEAGCSRIPVFDEDLDDIIGVLYVKDLLKFIGEKLAKNVNLKHLLREALFVPETTQCGRLFAQMTEKHVQMAIVIDEYGGTAGLITLEDLLESIVGNIQDEYDDEDEEITLNDDSTYTFDGMTDIEEFCEVMELEELPEGDFDTLAGLVISILGYIPNDNETPHALYNNLRFDVIKVSEKRIEKIKVSICDDGMSANEDTNEDEIEK